MSNLFLIDCSIKNIMVEIIDLIRNGTLTVKNRCLEFVEGFVYSNDCSDEEILSKLTSLSCCHNKLTSLPKLPNLTWLNCSCNQLTNLPNMSNLITLYCESNQLTSLPNLPNLTFINCCYNQITSIPNFPNLEHLYCWNNRLTSLPNLHNLTELLCIRNQLPSNDHSYWKKIWSNQSKLTNQFNDSTSHLGLPNLNRDLQGLIYELVSH